jgi:hypothetical protein
LHFASLIFLRLPELARESRANRNALPTDTSVPPGDRQAAAELARRLRQSLELAESARRPVAPSRHGGDDRKRALKGDDREIAAAGATAGIPLSLPTASVFERTFCARTCHRRPSSVACGGDVPPMPLANGVGPMEPTCPLAYRGEHRLQPIAKEGVGYAFAGTWVTSKLKTMPFARRGVAIVLATALGAVPAVPSRAEGTRALPRRGRRRRSRCRPIPRSRPRARKGRRAVTTAEAPA